MSIKTVVKNINKGMKQPTNAEIKAAKGTKK